MLKKRLLGVFAHPDDEGVMAGAFLHYRASGVETGLICATRGEVGRLYSDSGIGSQGSRRRRKLCKAHPISMSLFTYPLAEEAADTFENMTAFDTTIDMFDIDAATGFGLISGFLLLS